jgi:hypothetical protein
VIDGWELAAKRTAQGWLGDGKRRWPAGRAGLRRKLERGTVFIPFLVSGRGISEP